MAGIGDYIHYKKENYRKYGTTIKGPSNYGQATSIFVEQRNALKNRIPSTTSNNLQSLENFLNGMMYGRSGEEEYDAQAIQELQNRVSQVFTEKYSNFGLNFSKGMEVYYKGNQKATQEKSIKITTLEKYLQTIKSMADGSIQLSKSANVDMITGVINQLEMYLNSYSGENGIVDLTKDGSARDLLAQINKVLKMQSIPKALAIGDAFEYWLALASQYGGAKAVEVSDQLIIDTLVKGGNRSNPIISLNNFSDEYVNMDELMRSGAFNRGWQPINDSTGFMFNKPTQDKLDMVFNWEGDELKVSAKNYKLTSSGSLIHLVSGTSLLYLISGENVDFVNHWLNCISGTDSIGGKILQSAHIAMKLTILVKALTGMGTSSSANVADTFILNNRTQQHIYVRSMGQILNNVENLITKDINGVRFSGYPNRIPNKWIGAKQGPMSRVSAQARISNLIAALHTYNISVSITPEAATGVTK